MEAIEKVSGGGNRTGVEPPPFAALTKISQSDGDEAQTGSAPKPVKLYQRSERDPGTLPEEHPQEHRPGAVARVRVGT